MEKIHVLLFYKYVEVKDTSKFAREHTKFCKKLGILGRILVAKEGINGSVSGTKEQVEAYKIELRKDPRFKDILFKEETSMFNSFTKFQVKIKNEIVRFDQKVDLKNTGKHLTPEEFLNIYKNNEDVVVLDARNNYESRVGKFKGAITPDIRKFRDFPKVLDLIKDKKDKKIVMYCTGGIRCEKASAYLKENGFSDVYQLDGGILNFGKNFPDTIWEGKCFVFDKRLLSAVNSNDDMIANCEICNEKSNLYRNCKNKECDKLTVLCPKCAIKFNKCCSKKCYLEFLDYCKKKALAKRALINNSVNS